MIEDFLNETIIDFYCKFCEVNGLSKDKINEKFIDEDGLEMDDKTFIGKYINEIDEVIIDEVYVFARDFSKERDISLKCLVSFLASKFLLVCYKQQSYFNIVNLLINSDIDKIIELFINDDEFGRFMIVAYIETMLKKHIYDDTKEALITDQEHHNIYERLLYFEKILTDIEVKNINEILRGVICNLFNYYIENGCSTTEALNNVWAYFTHNFDALGELDRMGDNQNEKAVYKKWMLNLIFADLFEDLNNRTFNRIPNKTPTSLTLMTDTVVLSAVATNEISIPRNIEIRNNMLYSFIMINCNQERLASNRKNSYEKGHINMLKKVNPLYKFDELTFSK